MNAATPSNVMPATPDQWAQRVMEAMVVDQGKATIPEDAFKVLGGFIHGAADKMMPATAMVALATRLKEIPGSGSAADQVCALAAIALGDAELNGALCKALYGARGK